MYSFAHRMLRMGFTMMISNTSLLSKSIFGLLLQCGDIEKNPGPFPKVFSGKKIVFLNNLFSNNSFWQRHLLGEEGEFADF